MKIQISEQIVNQTIEKALQIQQVAAPTFGERKRADLVNGMFYDAELKSIERDAINNVYGYRYGSSSDRLVVISAHIDTVFPNQTDLTYKREADRLSAPGIGDNCISVAALITIQNYLSDHNIILPFDICFLANACEEGLGDLQGIRKAMGKFKKTPDLMLVLEGFGQDELCFQGIGSKRYKVKAQTGGGHSWSDYGRDSAIHTLVNLASELTKIEMSHQPKSSFNIGTIEGGTSINTIAPKASCLLDFRSESCDLLTQSTEKALSIINKYQSETTQVTVDIIGDRPAGMLDKSHWFAKVCESTYLDVFGHEPNYKAISTDANIPLSLGIPSVCIGLTTGQHAHRLDEYIDISPLGKGLSYVLELLIKNLNPLSE